MHELSIAAALVEQLESALQREHALKVLTVTLGVGRLSGVEPEALDLAFPVAAEGTAAQGARLVINVVAAAVQCEDCGQRAAIEDVYPICPGCGSLSVSIVSGRDLILKSVEMED